jgi:CobQ-like glutamine amidotransferase family enzyme
VIKLFSFEPALFNNNGDQGNLLVLERSLTSIGFPYVIVNDAEEADFVLVGDCALAVLNKYRDSLLELMPLLRQRMAEGRATLLVGRSYELLAPALGIPLALGGRESKYVEVATELGEIFGYHNSEVLEPRAWISGGFVGTTLFGPILAKNPKVLRSVLASMGIKANGVFFEEVEVLATRVREAITFE